MLIEQLRVLGSAKDKILAGPKSIYMDINNVCNINCNYCWIHSPLIKKSTNPKARWLKLEEIKKIIDQAKEWYSEEIIISGDGEPTLHPEFAEIINYIKQSNFRIFLTTNATFNDKLIPLISKIDHLYITFSAPQESLYRSIQSPNNKNLYRQVVKNIRVLGMLGKKYKHPYVTLAFIINSTNYKQIPAMLNLAKKLYIAKLNFRIMEHTKFTKPLLLSEKEKLELHETISRSLKYRFPFSHNLVKIKTGLVKYEKSAYDLSACFSGWFNIFIDSNKNVGLCCHNENLLVGNLEKKKLKKIWSDKKTHALRLKCKYRFNIRSAPFKGECEWCHWEKENNSIRSQIH